VTAFVRGYLPGIRRAANVFAQGADWDELEQQVFHRLLVSSPQEIPRLASYQGRAPLTRWLRVVVHRTAVSWLRDERADERARWAVGAELLMIDGTSPPKDWLKEQYRPGLQLILSTVVSRLGRREQALLRAHVVAGLSLDRLAAQHGVSQSTISRWMSDIRESVREQVAQEMAERFGLGGDDLRSVARSLLSRLDLGADGLASEP